MNQYVIGVDLSTKRIDAALIPLGTSGSVSVATMLVPATTHGDAARIREAHRAASGVFARLRSVAERGGEAMHTRGPYAGLCLACTAVQRKRLSQIQREAAKTIDPAERAARASRRSASAAGVRDVTRKIDQAAAELGKARVAEQNAMRAARAARDARVAAEQRIGELRTELDAALGVTAGASS